MLCTKMMAVLIIWTGLGHKVEGILKKFKAVEIAPWYPFKVIPNARSHLMCCSKCLKDPQCVIVKFHKDSDECELGDPTDLRPVSGGKSGLADLEVFLPLFLTVTITDRFTSVPVSNALVSIIQPEKNNETSSAITDSLGQVVMEVGRHSQLIIEVYCEGYFNKSETLVTLNMPSVFMNISFMPTNLYFNLLGSMTWSGEMADMDLHARETVSGGCHVFFENKNVPCYFDPSTYMSFMNDQKNFGADGAENVNFVGNFPIGFEALIYVHDFYETSALMYNANLEFALTGGPQAIQVVAAPGDSTVDQTHIYWIVGCFKVVTNTNFFVPINVYSTTNTHPCP